MANLGGMNFDARTVQPAEIGGGSLPVGEHAVVITSDEAKPTSNNDGGMLVLKLEIIDGPHKGVTGVWRLNLWNPNPKAVEIAHRQLSAICHAVNEFNLPNDTKPLHHKPFLVVVGPQDDPKYTEVKGAKKLPQGWQPQAGQPVQQQPQASGGWQPQGAQAQQQAPQQGTAQWAPPAGQQQPAQGAQAQGNGWQPQATQGNAGWQPNAGGQPQGNANVPAWAQR
jgi:hypothetical protein